MIWQLKASHWFSTPQQKLGGQPKNNNVTVSDNSMEVSPATQCTVLKNLTFLQVLWQIYSFVWTFFNQWSKIYKTFSVCKQFKNLKICLEKQEFSPLIWLKIAQNMKQLQTGIAPCCQGGFQTRFRTIKFWQSFQFFVKNFPRKHSRIFHI